MPICLNVINPTGEVMEQTYSAIDWTTLAEIIDEGKTVLFLGPEATVNYGDHERQNRFFGQLLADHADELHSYNQEDGLFVFSAREAIYQIATKVKRFYSQDYGSPMLEKLAQIPFHFIVVLTADCSLQFAMERLRLSYNEDYYDVLNERTDLHLPTRHTPPLFYHLLGTAKNTDTLIISHGQMYDFIRSFLGGTKLPQNIKTALNFQKAKSLIFLGINFDKWYFQLILNVLGVDAHAYNSFASIQEGETGLRTVWEKYFRIHFVPHHLDEFVNNLHAAFPPDKLRTAQPQKPVVRYKNASFIKYFSAAFGATDFDTFCLSYFDEVHNDFADGQGKSARVNKLIAYVQQNNQYENLLGLMKDENPVQFEKNAPYYE